jgi:PAS domain S-box-containing protein
MGSKSKDKANKTDPSAIPLQSPLVDDDAIAAIRDGRVDALVFSGTDGSQVFTLSGSENGYRLFVESMSEGAATVADDGTILYCNRMLAQMAGRPLEKMMGGNVRELFSDEGREVFAAAFRSALEGSSKVELQLAGHGMPVLVSLRAFREFGARAMCMVVTDLTEQKRHAELVSTGELARTILEQSAQAIAVCDTHGRVILASKALEELCGCQPALQRFDDLLPIELLPDNPDESGGRPFSVSQVLAGQSYRMAEVRLHRSDVDDGLFLLTANPLPLPSTQEQGCVVTLFDIRERKRSEDALRKAERLAATGRLAAVIAHEINNPLESVMNLLYLIHVDPSLDPRVAHYAQLAQAELARVAHITKQTLAFHRESNTPTRFAIGTLIESVLYLCSARARAKEIDLIQDLRCQDEIYGHPSELSQVLANIIGNAIEACQPGGRVWLRVQRRTEAGATRRRGVRILDGDTGPGVPVRDRHRIFEPLYTTKGEKGTGLGLWVSQGIIQKHDGTIRAWSSSRPERSGTVFAIFLPDRPEVRTMPSTSGQSAGTAETPHQRQAKVG